MKAKVHLGEVLTSVAAFSCVREERTNAGVLLGKARSRRLGTVDEEDKRANDQAVVDGSRILSAYQTLLGVKIWIITEAADDEGKRAATTIITPSEY